MKRRQAWECKRLLEFIFSIDPFSSPKPVTPVRAQVDGTVTYKAICVLGSRAATCTFIMAALVRIGPKAAAVTLRGTYGLGHYGKREHKTFIRG